MRTFITLILFLTFIIPLYSIPTPLRHQAHFVKHPKHQIYTNICPPQEYWEVTAPLPFDSLNAACKLPVLSHNFSNTYGLPPVSVRYSPPLNCKWSNVVLDIHVSCQGEQYDRIAAVWLNGSELIRTSTAEPTDGGIFWKVRKDVTRYSSLLAKDGLTLSVMLENIVNKEFTGVYQVTVTFLYYDIPARVSVNSLIALPGENEYYKTSRKLRTVDNPLNLEVDYEKRSFHFYDRPADLIIPISSSGKDGFWFRIQKGMDSHSKGVQIPRNTYRAVIEIYSSAHGDDEFWYSNPPDMHLLNMRTNPHDSYAKMKKVGSKRGHGAYREVLVKIDGNLVGSVVPFPVIYAGGINPLFWEPVVGIGAFDLPSYDLELTPFLGQLLDGKVHSFSLEVADGISFWLVDANLHLWLDAGSLEVRAGVDSSEPEFSLEREYKLDGLDGEFEIEGERKTKISGWVKMTAGSFTTSFRQELKFKNTIKFSNNGARKSVEHKVKAESELKIKSIHGPMIFHTITKTEYPLKVRSEILPANENGAYLMRAYLKNSFEENKEVGASSSHLENKQKSRGWLSVKNNQVLSGAANTKHSYSFHDGSQCYSRNVETENGTITDDDTSLLCVHSKKSSFGLF